MEIEEQVIKTEHILHRILHIKVFIDIGKIKINNLSPIIYVIFHKKLNYTYYTFKEIIHVHQKMAYGFFNNLISAKIK